MTLKKKKKKKYKQEKLFPCATRYVEKQMHYVLIGCALSSGYGTELVIIGTFS